MTLLEKQMKFAELVTYFLYNLFELGYRVTFGEAWRTKEQQEIYVKKKLSKTMNSKHLERLAIDLNFFKDGKWLADRDELLEVGQIWKSMGEDCVWGGDWNWDGGHFQLGE